jgi:hypothetical protein
LTPSLLTWAVSDYNYVRATADIDCVARLDEQDLTRLASVRLKFNARLRGVNAGGVMVWVVASDDLIRMKEVSGREQDLRDIHQLRDLHLPPE